MRGDLDRDGKVEIDKTDLQILAAKSIDPTASTRDIARTTGISKSTVAGRLKRLEDSPAIQECRQALMGLLPAARQVYQDTLGAHADPTLRLSAARDVLKGMGVFVERNQNEQHILPATAEQFVNAFDRLTTAEQDMLIRALNAQCGDGETVAADPDGGVVDGPEPSPDPQG